MPSTPLIACSSGVVTAVSTVLALAPVYTAVTCTVGGATWGYQAIGMFGIASRPASTMINEHTLARIGRLMKVSTNTLRGLHGRAIAQLLHVGDDDPLAGHQPAQHDIVLARHFTHPHRLLTRYHALLPLLGDEHEMLPGQTADRDDRHGQRRLIAPDDAGTNVLHDANRRRQLPQRGLHQHRLSC